VSIAARAPGADPAIADAAGALGRRWRRADYRLVYGAGDVGLMGAVARARAAAGGHLIGVIPGPPLRPRGRQVATDLHLIVTETMHERKKVMFMNADAVIALPGGAGTLDELFEVLTWRQLGLHDKPVILLDTAGYWGPLRALVEHVIAQGFAEASLLPYFRSLPDVPSLMEALAATRA
jgi:uncharacterized protein (TIGR00730 family)